MLPEVVEHTLILPFNDVEAVHELMLARGDEIAAILVEIIPHNIGVVMPRPEFLRALRALADRHGAVLIYDEVITGFRHGLGGYQGICGVLPDLAVFAKAMANGFPISALAGQAALMERFAPGGGVLLSGTYNGHALGVAAALATIAELEDGRVHQHCFALAERLRAGLQALGDELGLMMKVVSFGSVVVPYFLDGAITTYTDLFRNDNARDVAFRKAMCERGVFMIPTALKRNHISAAHTAADIDRTLEEARAVLKTF